MTKFVKLESEVSKFIASGSRTEQPLCLVAIKAKKNGV